MIDWRQHWILAGPRAQWTEARNALAFGHARYRFLVTLDEGRLRAFPNVCQHRGAPLLEEGCHQKAALRCGYHGWTYALSGALRHVPGREGFDPEVEQRHCLPELALREVDGLVWLAAAAPPSAAPPGGTGGPGASLTRHDRARPWLETLAARLEATGGRWLEPHAVLSGSLLEVVRPHPHDEDRCTLWRWWMGEGDAPPLEEADGAAHLARLRAHFSET